MEVTCSCEMSVDWHGVISQKTGLFLNTAVRTSNPTCSHTSLMYLD
jgi:hypothetical protein